MKIKAVIFDLDGTITEPYLDFDAIRGQIGIQQKDVTILEFIDKLPPAQRRSAHMILQKHEHEAVENSALNEHVTQTFQSLRERSISIGILTRNSRCNTLAVMAKHNLESDAVITREDGPVKPDAYGVLKLCEDFGCAVGETIVVGDYLHDLLCAKAAGAIAVLIKTHKDADQFSIHADYTISSLDQLLRIIESLDK